MSAALMAEGNNHGPVDLGTLNNSSAANLNTMGNNIDTLEMQRRLLAKTKTDKVNTLLKKSKCIRIMKNSKSVQERSFISEYF